MEDSLKIADVTDKSYEFVTDTLYEYSNVVPAYIDSIYSYRVQQKLDLQKEMK
jgi:hypothetical protein